MFIPSGHGIYQHPKKKNKTFSSVNFKFVDQVIWNKLFLSLNSDNEVSRLWRKKFSQKKRRAIKLEHQKLNNICYLSFEVVFGIWFLSKLFFPSALHAWDLRHWYELILCGGFCNHWNNFWTSDEWVGAINFFIIIFGFFLLFFNWWNTLIKW